MKDIIIQLRSCLQFNILIKILLHAFNMKVLSLWLFYINVMWSYRKDIGKNYGYGASIVTNIFTENFLVKIYLNR